MEEKIKKCFESLGIILGEEENFLLEDYITDSVTFISLIVEIESSFGIEIPDEFLIQNSLRSFSDVCNMVDGLLNTVNSSLI